LPRREIPPTLSSQCKIATLFAKEQTALDKECTTHANQIEEHYGEVGLVPTEVAWLVKHFGLRDKYGKCLALVERGGVEIPLSILAQLLGLSRSRLNCRPRSTTVDEIALKHRMDQVHPQLPTFGSRPITAPLLRDEVFVNGKAVLRDRQQMELAGPCFVPNLNTCQFEHQITMYLLRCHSAAAPYDVWGIDMTCIRLAEDWLYLVAVFDWCSRYGVAWEIDQTLEIGFVLATVDRALAQATPAIWNSDQGSDVTARSMGSDS
jgi:putative transposase